MTIKGSTRFQAMSGRLSRQIKAHSEEIYKPGDRKVLRKFAMREAADFLGVKQNTFRHYVSSMSDRIPVGEMDKSNRRYFTLEEIHTIQRVLLDEGKIVADLDPRRRPDEPCVVVTCFNLKGGSGKSTCAATLAMNLAELGYRVLACDLDSQASFTNVFDVNPEYHPEMLTAYDMIRYEEPVSAREVIQKTYFPNIDLIPADMSLMEFEYETALSFRTPNGTGAFHTRIANGLQPVLGDYDIVIFDTPPQLSFAVMAALFASQGVLIPLNASMIDIMSLTHFLAMAASLMEVVEAHQPDHGFGFVKMVLTRFEPSDQSQVNMASFLRTALSESVLRSEFLKSAAVTDAARTKEMVVEMEPRDINRKTYERVINSINQITVELEAEIRRVRGRSDGA